MPSEALSLVELGQRDHTRGDVEASDTRATPRYLAREIAVSTSDIDDAHSLHITTHLDLGRPEEVGTVVVEP
jgi:hypothetical protein